MKRETIVIPHTPGYEFILIMKLVVLFPLYLYLHVLTCVRPFLSYSIIINDNNNSVIMKISDRVHRNRTHNRTSIKMMQLIMAPIYSYSIAIKES